LLKAESTPGSSTMAGRFFVTDKEKFNLDVLYPSLPLVCILIAGLLDKHWKHFYFARDSHRADLISPITKKKH
jgi:hypothetical protein